MPVYRTSSNQTIVLFKDTKIGEPAWDDAYGSQTIVEKVHNDYFTFWKERNAGIKPEDISTEPVEDLSC
jgi:hypothetical protein